MKRVRATPVHKLCGLFLFGVVLTLVLGQVSFAHAAAPAAPNSLPSCGWILETAGKGATNVAYPDTDATYWTMPFDTTRWRAMVIEGEYPEARFFSFVTYVAKGSEVDSIHDVDIDPNPGSTNPFRRGPDGKRHKYTVTISKDLTTAPNHVRLGDTPLAWVIYRIYVHDASVDEKGGVALPRVLLIAQDGSVHPVPPCPFKKPAVQLLFLLLELRANGFIADADYWQTKFYQGDDGGFTPDSNCQPQEQVVFWIPENTGGYFPNPGNKYIAAPALCFYPDRVLVVRGKAGVFPDTHNGGPIWEPAIPGKIKLRYWSMCNNLQQSPYPVVSCAADWATRLDDNGFYTYVLGAGDAPSWLPADATWVPWGVKKLPNIMIFRNMLPKASFGKSVQAAIAAGCVVNNQPDSVPPRTDIVTAGECAQQVMGDYYPNAAYCDLQVLKDEGWQGCFAPPGSTVK